MPPSHFCCLLIVVGCLSLPASVAAQEGPPPPDLVPGDTLRYYVKTRFGPAVSYSQGSTSAFEVGLARVRFGSTGVHPFYGAVAVGAEFALSEPNVIGPKVSAWATGGMAFGLNAAYLSSWDGKAAVLVLKPEVGVGLFDFMLGYGYGGLSLGTRPDGLSRHYVTFRIVVP